VALRAGASVGWVGATSRAEGGWRWRSRGSQKAKVKEGAAGGDEAVACSEAGAEIKDGRRQCLGDKRVRALCGFEKLLSVA
jgi:hypothetical protein